MLLSKKEYENFIEFSKKSLNDYVNNLGISEAEFNIK
jgi:hypothetical protein